MSFKKIDYIENNHEGRITRLEVTIENINQTLGRIEKRFDSIDNKFITIDNKFIAMDVKFETRFDKLDNRLWMLLFWMAGSFAGVFIMLAKIKGWI